MINLLVVDDLDSVAVHLEYVRRMAGYTVAGSGHQIAQQRADGAAEYGQQQRLARRSSRPTRRR
jgi:hypothetical protein